MSACATPCGAYGRCRGGACACLSGWFGAACDMTQADCNQEVCSGRGECRYAQGFTLYCLCDPRCGSVGTACDICPSRTVCEPPEGPCPSVLVPSPAPPPSSGDDGVPIMFVLGVLLASICLLGLITIALRKCVKYRREAGPPSPDSRQGSAGFANTIHPAPGAPPQSSLKRGSSVKDARVSIADNHPQEYAGPTLPRAQRASSAKRTSFAPEMEVVSGAGVSVQVRRASYSSAGGGGDAGVPVAPRQACSELELGPDGMWVRRSLSQGLEVPQGGRQRERHSSSGSIGVGRGGSDADASLQTDNPLQHYAEGQLSDPEAGSSTDDGAGCVADDAASKPHSPRSGSESEVDMSIQDDDGGGAVSPQAE